MINLRYGGISMENSLFFQLCKDKFSYLTEGFGFSGAVIQDDSIRPNIIYEKSNLKVKIVNHVIEFPYFPIAQISDSYGMKPYDVYIVNGVKLKGIIVWEDMDEYYAFKFYYLPHTHWIMYYKGLYVDE